MTYSNEFEDEDEFGKDDDEDEGELGGGGTRAQIGCVTVCRPRSRTSQVCPDKAVIVFKAWWGGGGGDALWQEAARQLQERGKAAAGQLSGKKLRGSCVARSGGAAV